MKHTTRKMMTKTAVAIAAAVSMGMAAAPVSMAQENFRLFETNPGTGAIIMENTATVKANDSKEIRLFMDGGEFSSQLWEAATLTTSDAERVEVQKNSFGGSNVCSFNIYGLRPGTSDVTLTYNGVAYVCKVTTEGMMEFREDSPITGVGKTTFVTLDCISEGTYDVATKKSAFNRLEWGFVYLTVGDDTVLSATKSETEPGKIELKGLATGSSQLSVEYKGLTTSVTVEVVGNSIYFGEADNSYSADETTSLLTGEEKIFYATDRFEGINEEIIDLAQCTSSDNLVAWVEVDKSLSNNKVIAFRVKAAGSGIATISFSAGNASYTTTVEVATEKLSVESRDVSLLVGDEYPFVVSRTDDMKFPLSIMDGVEFESSNKKVAFVNSDMIKAKKAGKCTITVKYKDEFVKVNVTVKDWVTAAKSKKYKVKNKFALADLYKINAENAGDSVVYTDVKSSAPEVVKVNKNGKCVAKSKGKAVLTYSVNGHKCTTTIVVKG